MKRNAELSKCSGNSSINRKVVTTAKTLRRVFSLDIAQVSIISRNRPKIELVCFHKSLTLATDLKRFHSPRYDAWGSSFVGVPFIESTSMKQRDRIATACNYNKESTIDLRCDLAQSLDQRGFRQNFLFFFVYQLRSISG